MTKNSSLRTVILFIFLTALVVGLSLMSNRIWGGKPEQLPERNKLIIETEMTVIQFGKANELPNSVLKEIFGLKVKSDLENKVNEYGMSDQIAKMVTKKLALATGI
jgi:hypothetical protein